MLISLSVFVSAFWETTFEDKSLTYPDYPSSKVYTITYHINEPGWYLLPGYFNNNFDFADGQEFGAIHKSMDYRFAFSPFFKKYSMCERSPNTNPLVCSFEDIFGKTEEELANLGESVRVNDYFIYTALSADWNYYSKPFTVKYQLYPFTLRANDARLLSAQLKEGWNLIMYPPYLAYGDIALGDCSIEKAYTFIGEGSYWNEINIERFVDEELSGAGVAIKVANDCTFLAEKNSETPQLPALPD